MSVLKIGELIKAKSPIRIVKYTGTLEKSIQYAAKGIDGDYIQPNDICTIVDILNYKNTSPLDQGFYLILYKENFWINLWQRYKFHSSITVISFNEKTTK